MQWNVWRRGGVGLYQFRGVDKFVIVGGGGAGMSLSIIMQNLSLKIQIMQLQNT